MQTPLRYRTWKFIILAMVASAGFAQTAAAQAQPEPGVGSRIRIALPDSLRAAPLMRPVLLVTGTVVRTTQDSLELHVGGANSLSVARSDIIGLSVSEGTSRMRSAFDHALFGGLLFAFATYAVDNSEGHTRGRYIAIGAVSGTAIGAFLGAMSPFEHWRKLRR
ncbi:MAG TPA: hypothetical protein VF461_24905 [Gemmatimonadaceae bacterium]